MSKAKALGAGSSFQQTRAVSARRAAINATTEAPTEGTSPPVQLPVELISLNPANPRTQLGDLTDLAASLRDHGQKQAISIMSAFSYAEANPELKDRIEPDTKYVVIDGSSRLAAAREAGLSTIKVMLDDHLGSNPDELLESALVANIHRQDLDHLDEARALEQLLEVHGTQEALAGRLHRSQGWVAQRLALLKLTPELKERLTAGEESVDLLRRVGNKKPEEQEAHLQRLKEKKAQDDAGKKAQAVSRTEQHPSVPSQLPPVDDGERHESQETRQTGPTALTSSSQPARPGQPEGRPGLPSVVTVEAMPWGQHASVGELAQQWMSPEEFRSLGQWITRRSG